MKDQLQKHLNEDFRKRLDDHDRHLEIANQEMGQVKIKLTEHSTMLESLSETVQSINAKQWAILCGIGITLVTVIGFLIEIISKIK